MEAIPLTSCLPRTALCVGSCAGLVKCNPWLSCTVGNTVSLTWESFSAGQYTVQWIDKLVGGKWRKVPGAWPSADTSWAGEDIAGIGRRHYRVMSQ